jgi:hypothetical protein
MRFLPIAVLCVLLAHSSAHAAPWDKAGWQLTFQDEFDGAQVDATKWVKRYKWGEAPINGELQAYVDDAFQVQNGILSIVGDKRTATYAGQTFQYASGVLCSVREQMYGYFEARLKVPAGQGMWPAFWLLGTTGSTGVNEIDIHEILGNQPSTVYMTVHWGTDYNAGHQSDGSSWVGPDFSADFHTFGLEWNPDSIIWTIDGVERKRHTGAGVPQVECTSFSIWPLAACGPAPPTRPHRFLACTRSTMSAPMRGCRTPVLPRLAGSQRAGCCDRRDGRNWRRHWERRRDRERRRRDWRSDGPLAESPKPAAPREPAVRLQPAAPREPERPPAATVDAAVAWRARHPLLN